MFSEVQFSQISQCDENYVWPTVLVKVKVEFNANFMGSWYKNTYLLLAEFSVRTVNYGPSFFPSIYGPSAKRLGHKSMEKNEDP